MWYKSTIMETQLTHEQSLQIIQRMVENTRHNLKEDSKFYLLWGWLALAAGAIQLALLLATSFHWHWITWVILMPLGGIVSGILAKNIKKKRQFSSQIDRMMGYVWTGMVFGILFILALSFQIGWALSYILVIMMYGLGTFISGGLLKFKPLIYGGMAAWAIGIAGLVISAFTQDFTIYLALLCLSLVVSYLIPGYMLKNARTDV